MNKLREFWRTTFDIREGEALRTFFMALYLLLVLLAYYILKPVSRAMFLNKFDIDVTHNDVDVCTTVLGLLLCK